MATLTFDETEIFSILAKAKVPKAHAEAMVQAFRKVHVDTGELATKHGLEQAVERLETKIELLRRDTEITAYRTMLIGVGLITGIMAVMFNFFS